MMAKYIRKTVDEYEIQGQFDFRGKEWTTVENTKSRLEANEILTKHCLATPKYKYRIKKTRVSKLVFS